MTQVSAKRRSDGISAEVPDWSRETRSRFWAPPQALIGAIRSHQRQRSRGGPISAFRRMWATLRYRFWSVVTGAEIPLETRIEGGLVMPHPNGIVIHADAVIGPNCLILQQVTLGANARGAPIIGGHVDIGAGAKILGAVTIGDHAMIGANALVVRDVPAGGVVMAPLGEIRTRLPAQGDCNSPPSGATDK